jgi:cell division control protein 6
VKFNTSSGNGNVKAVSIGHMMRIFNEINPMTNSNLDKNTMPLMQKILLCTILLCNKDMKVKEIQFSKVIFLIKFKFISLYFYFVITFFAGFKLFDKFNKISKAYSTTVDSESEFVNLCTLLQDNGLVDVKKTKDVRSGKVSLRIDEQELNERLQDENFMADILTNPLYK